MFRLLLLMAMGLGALYMMHLLAQDYNKIRQPVAAAARLLSSISANVNANAARGKRDTYTSRKSSATTSLSPTQHLTTTRTAGAVAANTNTSLRIDWKLILSRDPFECLQSLICQLISGAEQCSVEAATLLSFLESTLYSAPAKITRAYNRGIVLRGHSTRCYDEYPFCVYSAKTMLRMLKWFADTPYMEADANAS